jgi:hypothetical protein
VAAVDEIKIGSKGTIDGQRSTTMRITIIADPKTVQVEHHPITGRPKITTSNPHLMKALLTFFGYVRVDDGLDARGRRRQ